MINTLLNSPYLFGMLLIVLIVVSLIIIGFVMFSGEPDNSDNTKTYYQSGVNGVSGKGNKYTRYNGLDK